MQAVAAGQERYGRGRPCPICREADNRCSLSAQGIQRCWNCRDEKELSHDPGWVWRGLATSHDGGQWGRWARANRCERCGVEDGRCWRSTGQGTVTFFCVNRSHPQSGESTWRFLGSYTSRKDRFVRGRWQSTTTTPTSRIVRKRAAPQPQVEAHPQAECVEVPVRSDWHPIHRWLWEQASPELRGRFPKKLADACITDTSYCRYLTAETIEHVQKEVHERWLRGEWSAEQIEASGWFSINRGFDSPHRFATALLPGRLIACFDRSGDLDQVRANPEVPPKRPKRDGAGRIKKDAAGNPRFQEIKYQQAAGVPTRPYLPKSASRLLARLKTTGRGYLLQITEGEDKAECMAQNLQTLANGTSVVWVSLSGVWNFTSDKSEDLHPELAALVDGASGVGIAFDSDVQSKKEVRQAMERLASHVLERTEGRIIPLAADWQGLLNEEQQLARHSERWGLDDLWGALKREGLDPATTIERLVSPRHARMVRRWWQRKGQPWNPEEQSPLLSLEEARIAVRETVRCWFDDGLTALRADQSDRIALAATCGVGKTTATMQELVQHVQRWWLAQADPAELHQWREVAQSLFDVEITTSMTFWCWQSALSESVTLAEVSFPAPGTLSEDAEQVLSLQRQLSRLEAKKTATLPDTPERWAVLTEIRAVREQLENVYHQGLGGSLLVVFKDRKALFDALADHVLPAAGIEVGLPPWLALRTGREAPEAEIPTREQIAPGSLACAHHEAVSELGSNRHSPSAGACQHCFYGQQGTCGFLDSLRVAHQAPVVFATIQAVLNASHELESFEQIICDEALDVHLVESMEIGRAVKLLLEGLQRGQAGGWYTLPPLYTDAQIQSLIAVFGEIQAALARFDTATEAEIQRLGTRLVNWCDRERLAPHLVLLKDLKPLRWNREKLEAESASYFPWERPRYTIDPATNQPLHTLTYGENQQIGFEFIPLRATTEILGDLYEAVVRKRPGAHLTLEKRLEEVAGTEDMSAGEATRKRKRLLLHLVRPQQHLIKALRARRVLNLDATPNRELLSAFLPDMRLVHIEAQWTNTRILQVLSGPMGRATTATIQQILPLVSALGSEGSVLMFSHKRHLKLVDQAVAEHDIPGLLDSTDAQGKAHKMAWFGYQDRAVDDPTWKAADYLLLVGAHRINIGHSLRLAMMLRRFRAIDGRPAPDVAVEPYRSESYGPEGYELLIENSDPILDGLIEHERLASLIQALQRPRPVSRTTPLTIILMRSDPVPAPYNRYVEVVSTIEEMLGMSVPLKNRSNIARHLEGLVRHSETICDWFVTHHTLPTARQVEAHGKALWGVGGNRSKEGALKKALGLWSAQLLPSLLANGHLTQERQTFLEQLRAAVAEHFDIHNTESALSLTEAQREAYWLERYRQGQGAVRLLTWMCTRHLSVMLQQQLEAIEPIVEVLRALRSGLAPPPRAP